MAATPLPPNIEQMGSRAFSFFPAIVNIEHNEWTFQEATWSEVLVQNVKSGEQLWVPKRFIGEVARVEEPVAIVGLNRELELKMGSVVPHTRRVIQMPRAVNEGPRLADGTRTDEPTVSSLQSVAGISGTSSGADSKVGKMLLFAVGGAIVLVVLAIALFRDSATRVSFTPIVQSDIVFNARDDYFAVERRLGKPAQDQWLSEKGELQYRYLWYPNQSMAVILMGTDRDKALYIGELSADGHVIHSVDRNMEQILRRLKRPAN
ncbi:hypothetical protein F183_A13480 [Bryobacterales bacterium F-183]|nr:hypothetical protein F183_A13480 [Bryobacterales bacterium F-183]